MRVFWVIFAWLVSASLCRADYLPAIGPAPLRFDVDLLSVQVVSNLATLPGAEITAIHPVTNTVANPVESTPPVSQPEPFTFDWFSPTDFASAPITDTAPAVTNYVRSGPATLSAPEPSLEIVTPQMMVHYFQPTSTNPPLATIPIVFVPPQPPSPSSKATFKVAEPEQKQ